MFRLRAPSKREVLQFIAQQERSVFSYSEVGASAADLPSRYNVDRSRVLLGRGEVAWHSAIAAIRAWQMFNIPWVRLYWPTTPIKVNANVAILVHHFGFYSLNGARIVYVVNEDGPIARHGFAYGTLIEHAERGEERFTVEWNRAEDTVWYTILAFSRPQMTLARLGHPVSRIVQRRFAEASKSAMLVATSSR
ncbi:MAG TPA: DUF1990 domain-containing protein [Terriglobales bacterium]|nr:DUF1990 domain-containing protein [Terriglobales bacterium]